MGFFKKNWFTITIKITITSFKFTTIPNSNCNIDYVMGMAKLSIIHLWLKMSNQTDKIKSKLQSTKMPEYIFPDINSKSVQIMDFSSPNGNTIRF